MPETRVAASPPTRHPGREARSGRRAHRGRRIAAIVVASIAGVVVAALAVVLVLGGILVPAHYLDPWSKTYADRFADPRMKVVAAALLAPSSHNMQPWTVRLDGADASALTLYADPARLTPAVDPLSRQTMVSQGTFLAYLEVAAAKLGYRADVALFAGGAYDENALAASMRTTPVARVTLVRDSSVTAVNDEALYLSDTNRSPYAATPLSATQTRALLGVTAGKGVTLRILTSPSDLSRLGAFGREGTVIESENAAVTAESDRLFVGTEGAKNTARSGFGVEGQGTSGVMKYLLQGAIRVDPGLNDDATGAARAIASTKAAVAATPAYGMITTAGNTRLDQVRAGLLYARVSLTARTLGLVAQPLSQVLEEYPAMATPYARIHREYAQPGQSIQMLVRLGTATTEYPVSMRRDATALVAGR